MKVILQGFEPEARPLAAGETPVATAPRRKSRVRLQPISTETRLFHAFSA